MQILKYLFLLLVLFLIGATVFVATQKGTYATQRSRFIKLPKPVVYAYVSDFKNWEQFESLDKSEEIKFSYPSVTSGKNASMRWESAEADGKISNLYVKENDSISQRLDYNQSVSRMAWKFRDSAGGTKVTWTGRGQMSFLFKIKAITSGGVDKLMGAIFEQGLNDLDRTLEREVRFHKISEEGLVDKPAVKYLKQSITSKIENLPGNVRIMIARMRHFFKKNNIPSAGNPFVVYERFDQAAGLCRFSVCVPVSEEIFISPGSDVQFGKMPQLRALKVTLKGDVSYLPEARNKAKKSLSERKLESLPKYKWIEVIESGIETTNRPSQWVTSLYFPVGVALPQMETAVPPTTNQVQNPAPVQRRPAPKPVPADTTR